MRAFGMILATCFLTSSVTAAVTSTPVAEPRWGIEVQFWITDHPGTAKAYIYNQKDFASEALCAEALTSDPTIVSDILTFGAEIAMANPVPVTVKSLCRPLDHPLPPREPVAPRSQSGQKGSGRPA